MLKQSMLKYTGKLIGQIVPGVMATLIGAYLVQQIFPGKPTETPAPGPAQPTAAVMSPTPMAPASKLAKGLSGPPAEPTEVTGPNKSVKEPVKEAAAPAAAKATPAPATTTTAAPATTGTVMPRRVGPPGPVPVVARERVAEPPPVRAETPPPVPAREEAAVPPLELAAKVIAALPPGKTSPSRDLPETRDGDRDAARDGAWAPPPPNVPPPAQAVSVAPLPPPRPAPSAAAAPMPIVPPSAGPVPPLAPPQDTRVPLAPPPEARAPLTNDPVAQLSDADRENLARIPLPLPDGVEPPPRRPSLFERGGALVKGVVSSVRSVLPGQH